MNLKVYDSETGNLTFNKEFINQKLVGKQELKEDIVNLNQLVDQGYYRELSFEGVHIGYGYLSHRKRIRFSFESDFETIEMHFALQGHSAAQVNLEHGTVEYVNFDHNIIYGNCLSGNMLWDSPELQVFEINFTPSFFKRFLPEGSELFDQFRNRIEQRKSTLFGQRNARISAKMFQIIQDILACKRQGVFKRMFLESKIIELLMLQFEQFSKEETFNSALSRSTVERIYAARDIVVNRIDADLTLMDLAHQVGTNECTLKKGFKEVFGTTVFAFWRDAKMDRAIELLEGGELRIAELAELLGYKNQKHFSTAFKTRFGISPSQFKG